MRVRIICPAPRGSRTGNWVTAARWAGVLRGLGHSVTVTQRYCGEPCDVLIAMHARRSFDSARRFRKLHPERPLIVALTGTDLYGDIRRSRRALQALDWARRLIVLQPLGTEALPPEHRRKVRIIYQSAPPLRRRPRRGAAFTVCVIANLREVKDPLRTARAAQRLPAVSRLRVVHAGKPLSQALARRARAEMRRNPRYRWLGELPHARVRRLLAASQLLVLSSKMEGGANVISEAVMAGVPVIASRIPGSVGLLGSDYPGWFPVGDTAALASLLQRAEADAMFYARLRKGCARRARFFERTREQRAWERLMQELSR